MSRKVKYFVVIEGSDRAIVRSSEELAQKKKRTIQKYKPNCKVTIFVSDKKLEE